jgi:hypothetical protein
MTLAIEAVGLVKRFGKTLAVDGVDLAVRPGIVLTRQPTCTCTPLYDVTVIAPTAGSG